MRRRPGEIRDAIEAYLTEAGEASVTEVAEALRARFGTLSESSVRSSLRLLDGDRFIRTTRGRYRLKAR